jgi:hypothetical protein
MKRLFVVISIKKIVIVFVCKKHMHYSVQIFCGEFSQIFLGSGVTEMSVLGRRSGEKVKIL